MSRTFPLILWHPDNMPFRAILIISAAILGTIIGTIISLIGFFIPFFLP